MTSNNIITSEKLIELGFLNNGGSLYRKIYNGFVIDALPAILPSKSWNIELRAGSNAMRIEGKVETLEELEILIRILDRKIFPL